MNLEGLRSMGLVKCFGLALVVIHSLLLITTFIGYGWEDLFLYVDNLTMLRWIAPLVYGLVLLTVVPQKYLMPSVGGYLVVNSVPNLIHNIDLLENFGLMDITCMILVYSYLVQLVGGLGLLCRNNNLGIILPLVILVELMITFWNPIYIYRRDWGSFLDLILVYLPDMFRMAAMVTVAYVLVRPEMYQTRDVDAISDNVHRLMPFITLPSDSYILRDDMLRVVSCVQDDRGWDVEQTGGWVVAESMVDIGIPLEKPQHLLLQKMGDGSIAVSMVSDPAQSYITGMSFVLDSIEVSEDDMMSLYGKDSRFMRIRILESPENRSVMDMLSVRPRLGKGLEDAD